MFGYRCGLAQYDHNRSLGQSQIKKIAEKPTAIACEKYNIGLLNNLFENAPDAQNRCIIKLFLLILLL